MRTISAANDKLFTAAGGRRELLRVSVKDSGGTFRDLTTYPGQNLVNGASWREDIDSPGLAGEVTLAREVELLSLSPLMADSPLNKGFNPSASSAPLIDPGRELKIETAVVPDGMEPVSGDWQLVCHGYIDKVNWGQSPMTIEFRGLHAKLQDTFIETERVYAYAQGVNATKGVRIFETSTAYVLNELVMPTEGKRNGHFYKVTTAGTSATSEPTWPTGSGSTVSSGGVTFTEQGSGSTSAGTTLEAVMQQILNDNLTSPPTLSVPASPGWAIRWYKQDRVSLWDALQALANQQGLDLRYRYDSGTTSFKLTLTVPDRTKTTADRTFGEDEKFEISKLEVDIAFIRNVIRVIYSDSSSLDPQNNPIRKIYEATDSASVTRYGRRFMEVAESSASNIDTSTEAQTFANAMRDDLATPLADQSVTLPYFPFVELGDLYAFSPTNSLHYSTEQKLAVVGYEHSFDGATGRTNLDTRGKPAGAYRKHLLLDTRRHKGRDTHQTTLLAGSEATLNTSPSVGGTQFKLTVPARQKKAPFYKYEIHVSDSPSFTPDSSTLKHAGAVEAFSLPNLIPGKTYYAKAVPFGHNAERIVRGGATEEVSFVSGQAAAGHLNSEPEWGRRPLNGGFESRSDTTGMPDHWSVVSGDAPTVVEGANVLTGDRCLRVSTDGDFDLISDRFVVSPGFFSASWWTNNDGGGGGVECYLKLYDVDGVEVDEVVVDSVTAATVPDSAWYHRGVVHEIYEDDGVCFAAIGFRRASAGDMVLHIDAVSIEKLTPDPVFVREAGASRSTTSATFATMFSLTARQTIPGRTLVAQVSTSLWSAGAGNTAAALRVSATMPDGSTVTSDETQFYLNDEAKHHTVVHVGVLTGCVQTGHITLAVQWRRVSGSGTITQDSSDFTNVEVRE